MIHTLVRDAQTVSARLRAKGGDLRNRGEEGTVAATAGAGWGSVGLPTLELDGRPGLCGHLAALRLRGAAVDANQTEDRRWPAA